VAVAAPPTSSGLHRPATASNQTLSCRRNAAQNDFAPAPQPLDAASLEPEWRQDIGLARTGRATMVASAEHHLRLITTVLMIVV
jgi:hypothetical protein